MKKRQAFTLIEMIIVITLIALMAGLAVSNFGNARQQATLDLATDLLVSTIKQRQQLAKSGKTNASDSSEIHGSSLLCYGLIINPLVTEDENPVQLLEAPYISYKDLDSSIDLADVCDFNEITSRPLPQLDRFIISDVTFDGNEISEPLTIFFKPPFSKPIFRLSEQVVQTDAPPIVVMSVSSSKRSEKKEIQFDSASGLIQRL